MTTAHNPTDQPRVLVGVDGSTASMHALRWAQYLAESTGAAVEAVHAWQPPASYGWAGSGWPADWDPADDARRILEATVNTAFGDARPQNLQLTVLEGGSAQILIEFSRDATMLVVGSRGHGGFAGLLLGSVSAACAEHAACPVLVLHGDAPIPGHHQPASVVGHGAAVPVPA